MLTTRSQIIITSHATMGPLLRVTRDGTILTSRMPYEKRGRKSIRQPTETQEVINGKRETVFETLRRGIEHECAKKGSPFTMNPLATRPILTMFDRDEESPGGTHLKTVFPVETTGDLRDYEITDPSKSGDEILGPVTMVPVEQLLLETEGKTVKFHSLATYALIEFATWIPGVSAKYKSYVEKWRRIKAEFNLAPTPEEELAMEIYYQEYLGE